jgi:hypothetical protein
MLLMRPDLQDINLITGSLCIVLAASGLSFLAYPGQKERRMLLTKIYYASNFIKKF